MARALIVIDMLRDFVDPDGALSCGAAAQAILPAVAAALRQARRRATR